MSHKRCGEEHGVNKAASPENEAVHKGRMYSINDGHNAVCSISTVFLHCSNPFNTHQPSQFSTLQLDQLLCIESITRQNKFYLFMVCHSFVHDLPVWCCMYGGCEQCLRHINSAPSCNCDCWLPWKWHCLGLTAYRHYGCNKICQCPVAWLATSYCVKLTINIFIPAGLISNWLWGPTHGLGWRQWQMSLVHMWLLLCLKK